VARGVTFLIGFLLFFAGVRSGWAAPVTSPAPVTQNVFSYEPVWITFFDSRLVNLESVETTPGRRLDFRIAHRFGDAGGVAGTAHNFWGLDQGENIRLALAYGVTDDVAAGIGRSRGAATQSPVHELYDGFLKTRILRQTTEEKVPISVSVYGSVMVSSQKSSADPLSPAAFPRFDDRLSYALQPIAARKFTDRISLEVLPTYVRRNAPGFDNRQNFYGFGLGLQWRLTERMVFLLECYQPLENDRREISWSNPLAGALQIPIGGHIFDITLSNTATLEPAEYVPYIAKSAWDQGQFRLGFNIARLFEL
jgi:hypothetical protein